jgi:ATPase subunit of ABC transporter with duplicated ATPase domains
MSSFTTTPQITLSDLSAAAPDGHPLFSHVTLAFGTERTALVGQNGAGKTTLLNIIAGDTHPHSGTVHCDGSIGYLRQWPDILPDLTVAQAMGIADDLAILAKCLNGEASPDELDNVNWTIEADAERSLDRMALGDMPLDHAFGALSGGQQTRVRLAGLIVRSPDFLLLDEPTNHLDREGRNFIRSFVANWKGGLIVVSHDRQLLEGMDRTIEISGLGVRTWGGNYSFYRDQKALEEERLKTELEAAQGYASRTARLAQQARERKQRRDAAGQKGRASAGQPKILLDAAKNRAENSASGLSRVSARLEAEAGHRLETARSRLERVRKLNFETAAATVQSTRTVLSISNLKGGPLANRHVIDGASLMITGPQRIAIEGPNGAGKTTLLRLISGDLPVISGSVECHVQLAYLDQSAAILDFDRSILDNFRRLNPQSDDNAAHASLARFHFRNDRALALPRDLSGGERLRAALACAIGGDNPAGLLLLDEPANHLDLESVAAVENALCAYEGALIAISHDEPFLENIGINRRITLEAGKLRDSDG